MKPLSIEMKAFGSYQEERIDFTAMEQGVFLITGDTGAGKTTIFDAITYALYGETSGGKRNGEMMLSQYVTPGTKTQVTLTFRYRGQVYQITRSPDQPKWRKKKEGGFEKLKTSTGSHVELLLPDGTVFPGKTKETNERIQDIIGLSASQFTQVAMLAQGEFIKLLHATSEERKDIFSKLFDTLIYEEIQKKLAAIGKEFFGKLAGNREDILREFGRISCVEGSLFQEEWESLEEPFTEIKQEELLCLVEKICVESENRLSEWEKKKEKLNQGLDKLNQEMQEAERVNQLFLDKRKWQQVQEELAGRRQEIKEKQEDLDKARQAQMVEKDARARNQRRKEVAESDKRLGKIRQWLEQNQETGEILSKRYQTEEARQEQELPELTMEIRGLEESLTTYEKVGELQKVVENTSKLLMEKREEGADLTRRLEVCEKAEESLTEEIESLRLQVLQEDAYQKIMAEQSVRLRGQLQEGKPCPVCGSIHHPAVDEDGNHQRGQDGFSDGGRMEEELQKDLETSLHSLQQESQRLKKQKAELAEKGKSREENRRILEESRISLEKVAKEIGSLEVEIAQDKTKLGHLQSTLHYENQKDARRVLEDRKNQAERMKEQVKNARQALQNFQKEEQKTRGACQSEEEHLKRSRQALEESEKTFLSSLQGQGFSSEKEFRDAILETWQMEEMQEEITTYQENVKVAKERLAELEIKTQGKEEKDLTIYREKKEQLLAERSGTEEKIKEVYNIAAVNRDAWRAGVKLYRQREKIREQAVIYKHLDDTANGRMSGKHINFQTYIQRRYFRKIINKANQRLYPMSGNQFILQCRELEEGRMQGRAQAGLDLDVYSVVNDQVRDVKTLSGGESFIAALSMALGMADMIQSRQGRVHIDTMFIDEGFGSLSEETRNQAIAILQELSGGNRLVGIISHVSELKAQVDTKLVVRKSEKGSHAVWEY